MPQTVPSSGREILKYYKYANKLTRGDDLAMDLVHDAWIRTQEHAGNYDPEKYWMMSIKSLFLNEYNKRYVRLNEEYDVFIKHNYYSKPNIIKTWEANYDANKLCDAIDNAYERASKRTLTNVFMKELDSGGYGNRDELADELGITAKNYKTNINTVRKILKKEYGS